MQPWTTCINVDQSLGNALARVSRFTSSIAVDLPSPRVLEHSYRQFMEKPPASCSVDFARSKPSRSVFWTIPEDSCKFQVFLRDVERLRGSALRGEDSERAETDLRNEPEPEPELLFCVWRNEPEPEAPNTAKRACETVFNPFFASFSSSIPSRNDSRSWDMRCWCPSSCPVNVASWVSYRFLVAGSVALAVEF